MLLLFPWWNCWTPFQFVESSFEISNFIHWNSFSVCHRIIIMIFCSSYYRKGNGFVNCFSQLLSFEELKQNKLRSSCFRKIMNILKFMVKMIQWWVLCLLTLCFCLVIKVRFKWILHNFYKIISGSIWHGIYRRNSFSIRVTVNTVQCEQWKSGNWSCSCFELVHYTEINR